MYRYFKSSKRKYSQDCVIRSIMVATGWTWAEVFNALVPICLKELDVPNADAVYKKFFKEMNWKSCVIEKITDRFGQKRYPTVKQFAEMHPVGTYILIVAGHMVCVKEGDWIDNFNCEDCKVRKYWEVSKDLDWTYYDKEIEKSSVKSRFLHSKIEDKIITKMYKDRFDLISPNRVKYLTFFRQVELDGRFNDLDEILKKYGK